MAHKSMRVRKHAGQRVKAESEGMCSFPVRIHPLNSLGSSAVAILMLAVKRLVTCGHTLIANIGIVT